MPIAYNLTASRVRLEIHFAGNCIQNLKRNDAAGMFVYLLRAIKPGILANAKTDGWGIRK
jgi:hypothetical protein